MVHLRRARWALALCGLAMITANGVAQVQFSALVDLVLNPGLDIASDTADSESNTASRGDDPFHTIRGRLFMDGDVAEGLSVNTRFLFDHDASSGQPIVRLDGAFATFWSILGIDALNVQVGNVPWPFGSFGPRTYSDENPVIGAPLMYSYHTQVHGGGAYASTSFVPPQPQRAHAEHPRLRLFPGAARRHHQLPGARAHSHLRQLVDQRHRARWRARYLRLRHRRHHRRTLQPEGGGQRPSLLRRSGRHRAAPRRQRRCLRLLGPLPQPGSRRRQPGSSAAAERRRGLRLRSGSGGGRPQPAVRPFLHSSPRGCTRCGRCPTSFQTSACGLGSWRPATTCCRNCTLLPDTIT